MCVCVRIVIAQRPDDNDDDANGPVSQTPSGSNRHFYLMVVNHIKTFKWQEMKVIKTTTTKKNNEIVRVDILDNSVHLF